MSKIKTSRLQQARKRLGFEQKRIVNLLGYKTIPPVSRYENGKTIPSLKVALKLSIIYRLPIRVLFESYYEKCRRELNNRSERLDKKSSFWVDLTEPTDYCSYTEMINASFLTDMDKKKIQKHVLNLMAERRQKILGH